MKEVLKNAIVSGMSYNEYNLLFKQLVSEGRTTGKPTDITPEEWQEKVTYTKLNFSRSKRLDKTGFIPETFQQPFKETCENQTWLVISEPWCGDAAQTLPYLNKLASLSDKINLKVVLRDEHPELMDLFLTNGSRSIPKLIVLNDSPEVLAHWGPRSQAATKLVTDYKTEHGQLDDDFKKELQVWYNKEKGKSIISELAKIAKKLCPEKETV
ncbi:thioredoxin family protein [Marixanthomonas spongiae]|uniref:Thioredoxin family protein n=1 Tax=Marixanthomonas spongiae TaxID=2174845 RepID=A0A2U0I442_9FLAO|nr:thioredoxin family protein [Marixanthomonas spongiae]PVW15858.1 thioredoxin family protein [Marixanthomonas spongiae]